MHFAVACKRFFGLKEGQKVTEFVTEIKDLSQKDKEELAPFLSKELNEEVDIT